MSASGHLGSRQDNTKTFSNKGQAHDPNNNTVPTATSGARTDTANLNNKDSSSQQSREKIITTASDENGNQKSSITTTKEPKHHQNKRKREGSIVRNSPFLLRNNSAGADQSDKSSSLTRDLGIDYNRRKKISLSDACDLPSLTSQPHLQQQQQQQQEQHCHREQQQRDKSTCNTSESYFTQRHHQREDHHTRQGDLSNELLLLLSAQQQRPTDTQNLDHHHQLQQNKEQKLYNNPQSKHHPCKDNDITDVEVTTFQTGNVVSGNLSYDPDNDDVFTPPTQTSVNCPETHPRPIPKDSPDRSFSINKPADKYLVGLSNQSSIPTPDKIGDLSYISSTASSVVTAVQSNPLSSTSTTISRTSVSSNSDTSKPVDEEKVNFVEEQPRRKSFGILPRSSKKIQRSQSFIDSGLPRSAKRPQVCELVRKLSDVGTRTSDTQGKEHNKAKDEIRLARKGSLRIDSQQIQTIQGLISKFSSGDSNTNALAYTDDRQQHPSPTSQDSTNLTKPPLPLPPCENERSKIEDIMSSSPSISSTPNTEKVENHISRNVRQEIESNQCCTPETKINLSYVKYQINQSFPSCEKNEKSSERKKEYGRGRGSWGQTVRSILQDNSTVSGKSERTDLNQIDNHDDNNSMAIDEAEIERLLEQSALRRRLKQTISSGTFTNDSLPTTDQAVEKTGQSWKKIKEKVLNENWEESEIVNQRDSNDENLVRKTVLEKNNDNSFMNFEHERLKKPDCKKADNYTMDYSVDDSTLSNINSVQSGYFDYVELSEENAVHINIPENRDNNHVDTENCCTAFQGKGNKGRNGNHIGEDFSQSTRYRSGSNEKSVELDSIQDSSFEYSRGSLNQQERIASYKAGRRQDMAYISKQIGLDLTSYGDQTIESETGDSQDTGVDNSNKNSDDVCKIIDKKKKMALAYNKITGAGSKNGECMPVENEHFSEIPGYATHLDDKHENFWYHEMDGNQSSNYAKSTIQSKRRAGKISNQDPIKVNVVIRTPSNVTIGYDSQSRAKRLSLTSYSSTKTFVKKNADESNNESKRTTALSKYNKKIVEADRVSGDNQQCVPEKNRGNGSGLKNKEPITKRTGITSPVPEGFKSFTELHRHKKRQIAATLNTNQLNSLVNKKQIQTNDTDTQKFVSNPSPMNGSMFNIFRPKAKPEDTGAFCKRHSFHMPVRSSGTFIKTSSGLPSPRRTASKDPKRSFLKGSLPGYESNDIHARRRKQRSMTMPNYSGSSLKIQVCGQRIEQLPSDTAQNLRSENNLKGENFEDFRNQRDIKIAKSEGADNTSNISFSLASLEADSSGILQNKDQALDNQRTIDIKETLTKRVSTNATRVAESTDYYKKSNEPDNEEIIYGEQASAVCGNKLDSVSSSKRQSVPNNAVVVIQRRVKDDLKRSSITEGISPLNTLSRSHKYKFIKRKEDAAIAKFQKYISQKKQQNAIQVNNSESETSLKKSLTQASEIITIQLSDSDNSCARDGILSTSDNTKDSGSSLQEENAYRPFSTVEKKKTSQLLTACDGQKSVKKSPAFVDLTHQSGDDGRDMYASIPGEQLPLPVSVRRCSFTPMICVPLQSDHKIKSLNDRVGVQESKPSERVLDLNQTNLCKSEPARFDEQCVAKDLILSNASMHQDIETPHTQDSVDKAHVEYDRENALSSCEVKLNKLEREHPKTNNIMAATDIWDESNASQQGTEKINSVAKEYCREEKQIDHGFIQEISPSFGAITDKVDSESYLIHDNNIKYEENVSNEIFLLGKKNTDVLVPIVKQLVSNPDVKNVTSGCSSSEKIEAENSRIESPKATETDVKTFEKCVPVAIHAKVSDFMGLENNTVTLAGKEDVSVFSNRTNNTLCESSLTESFPIDCDSVYDASYRTRTASSLHSSKTTHDQIYSQKLINNSELDKRNNYQDVLCRNESLNKSHQGVIFSRSRDQQEKEMSTIKIPTDHKDINLINQIQGKCTPTSNIEHEQKYSSNIFEKEEQKIFTGNDSVSGVNNLSHTFKEQEGRSCTKINPGAGDNNQNIPLINLKLENDVSENSVEDLNITIKSTTPQEERHIEMSLKPTDPPSQQSKIGDARDSFKNTDFDLPLFSNMSTLIKNPIQTAEKILECQESRHSISRTSCLDSFEHEENTPEHEDDISVIFLEDKNNEYHIGDCNLQQNNPNPSFKSDEVGRKQREPDTTEAKQLHAFRISHSETLRRSQCLSLSSQESSCQLESDSSLSLNQSPTVKNSNDRAFEAQKDVMSIVHTTASRSPSAPCLREEKEEAYPSDVQAIDGGEVLTMLEDKSSGASHSEADGASNEKRIEMYQVSPLLVKVAKPVHQEASDEWVSGKASLSRHKLQNILIKSKSPLVEKEFSRVSPDKYQKGSPRCAKKVKTRVASKIAEKIKGFLNKSKGNTTGQHNSYSLSPDSSPDSRPKMSASGYSNSTINSYDEPQSWTPSRKQIDSMKSRMREESSTDIKAVINVFEKQGLCEQRSGDFVTASKSDTKKEPDESILPPRIKRTSSIGSIENKGLKERAETVSAIGNQRRQGSSENGDNNNSFLPKTSCAHKKMEVHSYKSSFYSGQNAKPPVFQNQGKRVNTNNKTMGMEHVKYPLRGFQKSHLEMQEISRLDSNPLDRHSTDCFTQESHYSESRETDREAISNNPDRFKREGTISPDSLTKRGQKATRNITKSRARKIADEMISNLDLSQDSFNILFIENAMYLKEDEEFVKGNDAAASTSSARRKSHGHTKKAGIKSRDEDNCRDYQRR